MFQECDFGCMITDGWRTSMKQGKPTNFFPHKKQEIGSRKFLPGI